LFLSSTNNNDIPTTEAIYMPPTTLAETNDEKGDDDDEAEDDDDDENVLEKVELLGRGAAKSKRGKRKSGTKTKSPTGASSSSSSSSGKSAAALAASKPEEVFYEGPPSITETVLPTVSILTVLGIIPAAASWARQAWVRYRITTRRIRVNSGFGGKDMAEIVYSDIVELRTARRMFDVGDMVAFLRDGARFEMRHVPNFEAFVNFVLERVDPEVVTKYKNREGGNV